MGPLTRRIPVWGRVEIPKLSVAKADHPSKPGLYSGNTRGRAALVDTYRYPEVPADAPVSSRLAGPEQVFRVRLTRPIANFGVAIVSRGPGSRVEPRVVRGGDENRLTGYAALPFDQNPYVTDFGSPVPVAGAVRPSAGTYYVVFDSPDAAGAGTYRFRFWIDDVKPPAAAIVSRKVRRGDPIRVTVTDGGSGIDVSSIEATLDGREARAPLVGREIRVATGCLAPGRHRLRARALRLPGDAEQRERRADPAEHADRLGDRHDRPPLSARRAGARPRRGRSDYRLAVAWTPQLEEARLRRPHRQARPRPSSCARLVPRHRSSRAHASGRSSTTFTDAA